MKIPSVQPPETSSETPKRFEDKLQYMYIDLGNRGVWRGTMAPPLYKLAWTMGFQLIPPLFAKPLELSAFQGTTWGVLWALLMFAFSGGDANIGSLFELGKYGGVFFGLSMAVFYRVRAKMLNLPFWEDYC
jgi:hypothetical protein